MTALTKTILTAAVLIAGATQVQAAPSQKLSDTAYLQAVRCRGLAEAQGADTAALTAMLKAQKSGRDSFISERAKTMLKDAKREAGRSGEYQQSKVAAELSGACSAYIAPATALADRR
jgi:hypothetical protein